MTLEMQYDLVYVHYSVDSPASETDRKMQDTQIMLISDKQQTM